MTVLVRPVRAIAWELRGAWASRRVVRLTLSDRCDPRGVAGYVDQVATTDAFAIVDGVHIPLDDVLAIHRTHHTQETPA